MAFGFYSSTSLRLAFGGTEWTATMDWSSIAIDIEPLISSSPSSLSLSTPPSLLSPMANAAGASEEELPRSSSAEGEVEEEEQIWSVKERLLDHHSLNLRRHAPNNTSQVAIVGSNLCPIESLDYECWFFLGFFFFA